MSESAWLVGAAADTAESWRKETVALGFVLSPETLATVRQQLAQTQTRSELATLLNSADVREEWMKTFRERKRTSAEEKLLMLDDPRALKLLGHHYGVENLKAMAVHARREQRLLGMERHLKQAGVDLTEVGMTGRQTFLLCISFIVCMVGIANAMLMSITERFREIATMKCLGATDRFILMQFMLEAALQGLAGGILGVLAGFLIATIRGYISLGSYLLSYWPMVDVLISAAISLLAGILLSALASIHPSWSASRMAPMEAMRIE
jgi:hypothetical protein